MPLESLKKVEVHIGDDIVPIPKLFYDLVSFIRLDMMREGLFHNTGSKLKQRILVVRIISSKNRCSKSVFKMFRDSWTATTKYRTTQTLSKCAW